jgi:hypothetical protein
LKACDHRFFISKHTHKQKRFSIFVKRLTETH